MFGFERFRVLSTNRHISPRIKKIRVAEDSASLQDIAAFRQYARDGHLHFIPRPRFRECMINLTNLESIEFSVNMDERPGTSRWNYQTLLLKAMLYLLYDTRACTLPKLKSIKSDNLLWHSFQPPAVPHALANYATIEANASRLLNLDIKLRQSDQYSTVFQIRHLYKFLCTTISLEILKLDFGCSEEYSDDSVFSFGKICKLEFTQLRSLALSFGNVNGWALLRMFRTHRTTLKEVQLGSLALRTLRWNFTLNSGATWLRGLERIKLSGRLTDEWLHAHHKYMCGEHFTQLAMDLFVRRSIDAIKLAPESDPLEDIARDLEQRARLTAAGLTCITCGTCGLLFNPYRRIVRDDMLRRRYVDYGPFPGNLFV